jgi:hypothetical protein
MRVANQERYRPNLHTVTVLFVVITVLTGCGKTNTGTGSEASVLELNRGLAMWIMAKGAAPRDIHDLTNLPTLKGKSWPTVPADKKLVLDAKKQQIVVVDK